MDPGPQPQSSIPMVTPPLVPVDTAVCPGLSCPRHVTPTAGAGSEALILRDFSSVVSSDFSGSWRAGPWSSPAAHSWGPCGHPLSQALRSASHGLLASVPRSDSSWASGFSSGTRGTWGPATLTSAQRPSHHSTGRWAKRCGFPYSQCCWLSRRQSPRAGPCEPRDQG